MEYSKLIRRHDLWENEFVFKDAVAAAKTGALQLINELLQQNILSIAPKESFEASLCGTIEALMHDPGRGAPLALS